MKKYALKPLDRKSITVGNDVFETDSIDNILIIKVPKDFPPESMERIYIETQMLFKDKKVMVVRDFIQYFTLEEQT